MPSRRAKGQQAEELAAAFLKRQGIKIITRNWNAKGGELDIVGRKGDELLVIEVRSRRAGSPYVPEAGLGPTKTHRLHSTVEKLRQQYNIPHVPIRLDLLVVDFESGEIKHYPGGIASSRS